MLLPTESSSFTYFGLKSRCSLELFAKLPEMLAGAYVMAQGQDAGALSGASPSTWCRGGCRAHTHVWLKAMGSLQSQWKGFAFCASRTKLELEQSSLEELCRCSRALFLLLFQGSQNHVLYSPCLCSLRITGNTELQDGHKNSYKVGESEEQRQA